MKQFIGFTVNSSEYMIPILKVREIIRMPSVTVLPHLPSYVRGIANLRGNIIPIVNLDRLLDPGCRSDNGKTVIVLATGKITFGIIIDGITGVIKVNQTDIEPPENFFSNCADSIEGVAKLNNRLIILLDVKKLLPLDDLTLLEDNLDVRLTQNGDNVEIIREVDTMGGKVTRKELRDAQEYFCENLDEKDTKYKIFSLMAHFMDALGSQEYQKLDGILDQLSRETDNDLYREVGKITRKLHDSLEDFKGRVDVSLERLTNCDVPTAVDNLEFVIAKTEDAANRTMEIVERYFAESEELSRQIESLRGNDETLHYLKTFKESFDNDMTSILTAQQFQDITGQTIRKVIELVNHVEEELLNLIAKFGMQAESVSGIEGDAPASAGGAPGEREKNTDKISQSDVEALLNDFSF